MLHCWISRNCRRGDRLRKALVLRSRRSCNCKTTCEWSQRRAGSGNVSATALWTTSGVVGKCGRRHRTYTGCWRASASRLVSIPRVLSSMSLLLFLYANWISICYELEVVLYTSASLFQSLFTSGACSLHCSPMIFEISGFASPGFCAMTWA